MKITLRVNGAEQSHDVEPRQLLTYYLRDVTGVAATPYRPVAVEEALTWSSTNEAAVRAACESAAEGIEPLEDIHAGAPYRANLARVLCRRAALAGISRARGSGS
jgi:xanthine dehydrogenase iron-sulfur cluster and FAD-binding subunit A